MSKKTRIIIIAVIVLLIGGMALYPSVKKKFSAKKEVKPSAPMGKNTTDGNRNRPLNVNAQVLEYKNMNDLYRTKGLLLPDEEVDLSFETSGKITNIYFKEGSQVRKGDLLAKVNDGPLQAELKKLEAQKPLAGDRVFRQKALLAKDAVSQEAYESVTTELEKLNADIELIKAKIAQTELRAPFDGIIGLRFVSEGAYASPSVVVAKLTKITPLKVEFSVNESQANQIAPGTNLTLKLSGDLEEYFATVYAVESNLERSTLTMKARAIYPNKNGKLKPGHSANVEIRLKEIKNALAIPSQSIIAEMGRDIAYVYKDGKAQLVELTKGLRTQSEVQIIKGLNVGDTLITTGVMQLRDGMPIIIDNLAK